MAVQPLLPEEIQQGKASLLTFWDWAGDFVIESGSVVIFKDAEGKEYIDCTSQAWSLNVGYNHPRVIKAVEAQLNLLTHSRSTFHTSPQIRLAKKMAEIAPGKGDRTRWPDRALCPIGIRHFPKNEVSF